MTIIVFLSLSIREQTISTHDPKNNKTRSLLFFSKLATPSSSDNSFISKTMSALFRIINKIQSIFTLNEYSNNSSNGRDNIFEQISGASIITDAALCLQMDFMDGNRWYWYNTKVTQNGKPIYRTVQESPYFFYYSNGYWFVNVNDHTSEIAYYRCKDQHFDEFEKPYFIGSLLWRWDPIDHDVTVTEADISSCNIPYKSVTMKSKRSPTSSYKLEYSGMDDDGYPYYSYTKHETTRRNKVPHTTVFYLHHQDRNENHHWVTSINSMGGDYDSKCYSGEIQDCLPCDSWSDHPTRAFYHLCIKA